MSKAPALVILAAGMGSRFGGLKQITPVDDFGHAIIDFSLFDAYRAGFRDVVFIIKYEIEKDFKESIGYRMEKYFNVKYVYQQLEKLPEGYTVPETRVKPWGTGHAVLCAKNEIEGPFAVINADDYYGPNAYKIVYDFLANDADDTQHSMIGYYLKNTVTENGSVARGVCCVENGKLSSIVERTKIFKDGENGKFTENGTDFYPLPGDCVVSMNFWGFKHSILNEIESRFCGWLDKNLPVNPDKCEYFLPTIADMVIKDNTGSFKVLESPDAWKGITYKEDLPSVVDFIKETRQLGIYPNTLLD